MDEHVVVVHGTLCIRYNERTTRLRGGTAAPPSPTQTERDRRVTPPTTIRPEPSDSRPRDHQS
jgi:hypothetical protein